MSVEPKKTVLFRLYQVLFDYSDINHPLTQSDIIAKLEKNYGLCVERKAIGRNLSYLKEMGYDIVSSKAGSYLEERPFEFSELRFLIDSVLCNRNINAKHSKDLIDKIVKLGGNYFKPHVKHIVSVNEWNKTANFNFLLNVELADEAIECGKKLSFDYNKIGTDKNLHKTKWHKVSPYQMVLNNQRYYLMAFNEYWQDFVFYRMDKITNMKILEEFLIPIKEIKGYEQGINYRELSSSRPYMFSDKPERVVIACPNWMMDEIADWFGLDVIVKEKDAENIEVIINVSPCAIEYWLLQYGSNVEILEPIALREKVIVRIKDILNKYQ